MKQEEEQVHVENKRGGGKGGRENGGGTGVIAGEGPGGGRGATEIL